MSKKDDEAAGNLLIGAGIATAGYLIFKGAEKRRLFRERLAGQLDAQGFELVNCDMGRKENGEPVWHLTLNHPKVGVATLFAEFPSDTEPYSEQTTSSIVHRVLNWYRSNVA